MLGLGLEYHKLKGVKRKKNMLKIPDMASTTFQGLTISISNGVITVNGTSTGPGYGYIVSSGTLAAWDIATTYSTAKTLVSGKKYTFSVDIVSGTINNQYAGVYLMSPSGNPLTLDYVMAQLWGAYGWSRTFTAGNNPGYYNGLNVGRVTLAGSGYTYNNFKFRVQLEQNTAKTAWEKG